MSKIQENLKEFLSNPDTTIVSSGTFRVRDFNNLNKVLNSTEEDFLIFDNGGGRKFDIVFDRTIQDENGQNITYKIKELIDHLLKEHKNWIYCYQLNKEQFILRKIIS